MALVRGTKANTQSTVPSGGAPSRGNSGKNKSRLPGTNPASQSVVPATRPLMSDKRGGPAKAAPKGKSSISSGGGSFGQK